MGNTSRRQLACDACYRRKIRCEPSETGLQCNWCEHHNLLCTFSRSKKRTGSSNASKQRFAQRLEHVERRLANSVLAETNQATSDSTSTSSPQSIEQPVSPGKQAALRTCRCEPLSATSTPRLQKSALGQIYFAGQRFGTICPQDGIPHFTTACEEWIQSKTGQQPRFPSIFGAEDGNHGDVTRSSSTFGRRTCEITKTSLPERWILDGIFREFIASDLSLVFPLVDRVLFETTAELAYAPDTEHPGVDIVSAKACVLAFLATMVAHFPAHALSQHIDGDACAKEAQSMMGDFLEDTSITTLQTAFMLLLHESLCGHLQAASMYHAVACRTMCALGGHTFNFIVPKGRPLTVQDREDCQLRMLFWLCYVFDKDIGLRTGLPPIISDEFCDLSLPEGYHMTHFDDHSRIADADFQLPTLVGDLRLSILKSKAVRALYTPPSLRRSEAEILRTVRELDEELECWRSSIPANFAPSLSIRKDFRLDPDLTQIQNMLHISLHLEYHYLLNIIHGATGRCVPDHITQGSNSALGVQSSLDLAVEASRSTIIYLTSSANKLASEAFWVFVFYPVSAWMTLFFNILRNPRHEYARHDMKLLRGTSSIMWSLPIRRVTLLEVTYLKKISAFVEELGRLAEFAIEMDFESQENV